MPHALITKRILSVLSLLLVLSGCTDSSSTEDKGQITGRTIDIPDANKHPEPAPGEISTLVLSFQSPITGTVTYQSFNITAAEKSDYMAVSGSIEVVEGNTYSIPVNIYGDDEIEGNEQFGIRILDELGTEVANIVAQISNDDLPSLTVTSPVISEGDTGSARLSFELELSHPVVEPYTLTITSDVCDGWVDNSDVIRYASPCNDFEAIDITLKFEQGVQSLSFDVVVLSDDILEKDEIVQLSVKSAGINALPDGGFALGTIRTDEEPDRNGFELSMAINSDEVLIEDGPQDSQSDWNPVTYTVTVSNSNSFDEADGIKQTQSIEVNLQGLDPSLVDDDGLMEGESFYRAEYIPISQGSDFCINNPEVSNEDGQCLQIATIQLDPGTKTFEFTFYVSADLMSEPDENIEIILQNDQGVFFSRHFHQIQDDDDPELVLVLANGDEISLKDFVAGNQSGEFDYLVVNEEGGSLGITLKLANELLYPWSFSYTFNRPSNSGSVAEASSSDYARRSGEVTFSAGSVLPDDGSLLVGITDDDDYEGTELFGLNFVDINVNSLLINIIDDDFPALAIVMPNGDDISVDTDAAGNDYINTPEPIEDNLDVSIYSYKILLNASKNDDTSIVARTNLKLFYSILSVENDGVTIADDFCGYLSSPTEKTDELDYNLYSKRDGIRTKIIAGEALNFSKGESQINIELEINNDSLVECDEYLAIEFKLVDGDSDIDAEVNDTLRKIFKIENKDKSILSVYGWQANEGNSQGSLSTQVQNFKLKLDQSLVTNIPYAVSGGSYACNGEDVVGLSSAASVSFNGVETLINIPVNLIKDNIVEPQESCEFSIVGGYDSNLVDIQYCDENEACGAGLNAVQGVIVNDDFLIITVDYDETVVEPAELGLDPIMPVNISWDKDIAGNVGDIYLKLRQEPCDDAADCSEGSDSELTVDFEIKNGGSLDFISSESDSMNDVLIINADNVVENTEQLLLAVEVEVGNEYIDSVSQTALRISVVNEDKLSIVVDELLPSSTVTNNGEDGSRVFQISWGDKEVESSVSQLDLILDSTSDAVRKIESTQFEYEYLFEYANDDSIILSNSVILKGVDQELQTGGSLQVNLTMQDDSLVELEELISFSFLSSSDDFISNFNQDFSHRIGIDDKLQVSLTPPEDYVNDAGFSAEKDEDTIEYVIEWKGQVANNVPELSIDISHSGDALIPGDLTLTKTSSKFTGNTYQLKPAGSELLDGSDTISMKIEDDTFVETDESVNTVLQYVTGDVISSDYVSLDNAVNDKIALLHTITDSDKTEITLTRMSGSNSVAEEDVLVNTYALNWNQELGKGVPSISVSLPFLGSASEGVDYTVDVAPDSTGQLSISGNTFTIVKIEDEVLAAGSVHFIVTVINDNDVEVDETISAVMVLNDDSSTYATLGSSQSLAFTITDTDAVTLSLSQFDSNISTLAENAEETNTYTLTWDRVLGSGVEAMQVSLPFSGSATKDFDYQVNAGAGLTISGDTFTISKPTADVLEAGSVSFTVKVEEDAVVETEETFSAIMASAQSYVTLGDSVLATHTITDTDTVTLSLTQSGSNKTILSESAEETNNYTLSWNSDLGAGIEAMQVNLPFLGSAINGSDYVVNAGTGLTINGDAFTITKNSADILAAGSVSFSVKIAEDTAVETSETFSAIMTTGQSYVILGEAALATHTITDTDTVTLSLSQSSGNTTSSESAEATNTYTLSWNSDLGAGIEAMQVNLPFSGTATKDSDYVVSAGVGLNITGDTFTISKTTADILEAGSVNFTVKVEEDTVVETNETISATMTSAQSYVSVGNSELATHTITDADTVILSLSQPDSNLTTSGESVEATNTYTLTWNNDLGAGIEAMQVSLPFSGTATKGSDYVVNAGTGLTIVDDNFTITKTTSDILEAGSVSFTVKIEEDTVVEMSETFSAIMSAGQSYVTLGDSVLATHTITDTDTVNLSLSQTAGSITSSESAEAANTYTLTWNSDLGAGIEAMQVSLPFSGSATKDIDYVVNAGAGLAMVADTFTINKTTADILEAGSVSFTVKVEEDTAVESSETYSATMTTGQSYVILTEAALPAHTITDTDTVTLSLSQTSGTTTSSESTEATNTYTLTWNNDLGAGIEAMQVSLPFTGTATKDLDYVVDAGTGLTITGDTFTISKTTAEILEAGSVNFTVKVEEDTVVETSETISATMVTGQSYVTLGDSTLATHTITDSDTVTLSLAQSDSNKTTLSESAEETNSYTLTWGSDLGAGVEAIQVSLPFSGTAIQDSDYVVAAGVGLIINGDTFTISKTTAQILEAGSVNFTVKVEEDTVVETSETFSAIMTTGQSYVSLGDSVLATHTITDSDKTSLTLTRVSGLDSAAENDANTNIYALNWEQGLGEGIPSLTVALPFSGTAVLGTDYEINVAAESSAGLTIVGDTFTIVKIDNETLSAGSVRFDVTVLNDNDIELTEDIAAAMVLPISTASYAKLGATTTLAHSITDSDKATLTLTRTAGVDSASEKDTNTNVYALNWDQKLAEGVPSLTVTLPFSGLATQGSDYEINVASASSAGLTIAGDTFTIVKPEAGVLQAGSVSFELTVLNDSDVEVTETISAAMALPSSAANYASLGASTTLLHSITDSDKTTFTLTRTTGLDSAAEKDTNTNTYALSWDQKLGAGVPSLTVSLPFSGTAEFGTDYDVNVAADSSAALTIVGDTFTIVKAENETLAAGSVSFEVAIINDDDVEITENISAAMALPSSTTRYVTLGATTTLAHTITDADKTSLTLTRVSGLDSAAEKDTNTNVYSLNWGQGLGAGIPSLMVTLPFTGTAVLGTDYEINVATGSNADLTIMGDTFTIVKASSETLSAGSVNFEVTVLNDNDVEITESISAAMELPVSTSTYATLGPSTELDHSITDSDKTTLSLIRTSGIDSGAENDTNTNIYALNWDQELGEGIPSLTINLPNSGTAVLGTDYEVSVVSASSSGLTVIGDTLTLVKAEAESLSAGSVSFEVTVLNDSDVEVTETIAATMVLPSSTASYATLGAARTLTHSITDTDKTALTLTRTSGLDSAAEKDTNTNLYALTWDQTLGKGIPSLTINLPNSGTAELDSDYEMNVVAASSAGLSISDNTLTLVKADAEVLLAGSVSFEVTVLNDNDVEITESIEAAMLLPSSSASYATLGVTSTLAHTITDSDKTVLTLTRLSGTDSAAEKDTNTNTYALNWDQVLAEGIPSLIVSLPFSGSAALDADYEVNVAAGSAAGLTIVGDTLTIVKTESETLSAGSVRFEVTVLNDNDVETTESISAAMALPVNTAIYATLGAGTTLAHSITDLDKISLTLTRTSGTDSAAEKDTNTNLYALTWDQKLAEGVPSLTVTLPFSGLAIQGSDYEINVASASNAGLTILGDTFTIVKSEAGVLPAGSVSFEVTIINDDDVEITESIAATMGLPVGTAIYASLGGTTTLAHSITDSDKTALTLTRTSGFDSAAEKDTNTNIYALTWDQKLDSGVPSLAVSLPFSGTASLGSDYEIKVLTGSSTGLSISGDTFTIVKSEAGTLPSGSVSFEVTVLNDNDVEITESIAATMSLPISTATYATLGGSTTLAHNIEDSDTTTMSIAQTVGESSSNEKDEGSNTYELSWSNALGAGVSEIKVSLPFSSAVGHAVKDTDFVITASDSALLSISGDELTIVKVRDDVLSAGSVSFEMSPTNESIIELNEIVSGTLTTTANTPGYVALSTDNKSVEHTIINDDFINVYLSSNETSVEASATSYNLYWTGGNVSSDIPTSILYVPNVNGTVSSGDYTVESTLPAISVLSGAITENASGSKIVSIVEDSIIELNEVMTLSLALNAGTSKGNTQLAQFVKLESLTEQSSYDYTIENDDYVSVSTISYLSATETDQLQEGGDYKLQFCIPASHSIQAGNGNMSLTASLSASGTESLTLKLASCDDLSFLDNSDSAVTCSNASTLTDNSLSEDRSVGLDALSAGECAEITLINAANNADVDQNKAFDIDFSFSDIRCEGTCVEGQPTTIFNDDFINLLDTGLVECVEDGRDDRWDVPCSGNPHSPQSGYFNQDAAETTYYPAFSYTYINENAKSVQVRPSTGEICIQDNSTGLVWSESIASNTLPSDFTLVYVGDDGALADCGIADGSSTWQLPTVQELLTIMDLEPLNSKTKPLSASNIFQFKSTGATFYNDTARYWSSDICTTAATNDSAWTVDFISGHVTCELQTETNSKMKVYK